MWRMRGLVIPALMTLIGAILGFLLALIGVGLADNSVRSERVEVKLIDPREDRSAISIRNVPLCCSVASTSVLSATFNGLLLMKHRDGKPIPQLSIGEREGLIEVSFFDSQLQNDGEWQVAVNGIEQDGDLLAPVLKSGDQVEWRWVAHRRW